MILKLKIKPRVVKASSKATLLSKIVSGYNLSSTSNRVFSVWGYSNFDSTKFIMYNLHKVRAKSVRVKKNGKQLNNLRDSNRKINESSTQGYWIAYVYTFDRNVIETFGLHLDQKLRNFTITSI